MQQSLTTQRLILRPFEGADGARVVECLSDLEVSRWLASVPHPFTHADLKLLSSTGQSRWPALIAVTLNEQVVGGMSGGNHLGYWIAPKFWGRGIASEAAKAVVDHYFIDMEGDQMTSAYFAGNKASQKILHCLGFIQTAVSDHFCKALGVELPHHEMTLDREAWEARRCN